MPEEFFQESAKIDPPETIDSPLAVRHYWPVLGGLILLQTILGVLLFNPNKSGGEQYYFVAILGVLFSHPLLFALWATFAPQRFYVRFLWCLPLCFTVSFFISLKITLFSNNFGPSDFFFVIFYMGIFLIGTALFLLIRRFSGLQLIHHSIVDAESDYQPYQFGIKHIMILITISGLMMGLFKSLIELGSHNQMMRVGETSRILSEILLMVTPLLFLFWFTLAKIVNRRRSLLFGLIALAIIEITIFIFVPMMEGGSHSEMYQVIPCFQIGGGLSVFFSTLVIRWCGFRLVRVKKGKSSV
jgi:hypothetical protein